MRLDGTVLVVAPHQDDEVLGCGWLMQRVAAAGGRVVVAWLTDGGASHGDLDAPDRAALVARRQDEARAGLAALGIMPAALYFLGHPDGGLADASDHARGELQSICADHGVDIVLVTSDADRHTDHRTSFAIARGLVGVALFTYAVSARYDGEVGNPATASADLPAVAAKRAALAAHVSQTAAGGARFPLSAAAIDRFCTAAEVFAPVEDAA